MNRSPVDTSGWKSFLVGDLFEIQPTTVHKVSQSKLFEDTTGTTPVISNTSKNNGVIGFTALPPTEEGGILTFSDTVDANTIFYQPVPFVGYAHVQGMYPKDKTPNHWNEKTLMFFASVFSNVVSAYGFDYANKFNREKALKMTVSLPVKADGTLDWAFMENEIVRYKKQYVKEAQDTNTANYKRKTALAGLKDATISETEWVFLDQTKTTAEFRLGDVLHRVKMKYLGDGRRQDRVQTTCTDDYPLALINAKKGDNGIQYYGKKEDFTSAKNVISIVYNGASAAGLVYYQPDPIGQYTDAYVIDLNEGELTENIGLYLATVIQAMTFPKYSRDNKATWDNRVENDVVQLPIKDGVDPEHATPDDIDYDYMERYISILKKKKIQQVYDDRCEQLKAMAKM